MLRDVQEVKVVGEYKLFVRFDDGLEGEVNISEIIPFKGIFEKLKDHKYFKTVKVNQELGTIVWDNGADISPAYLYSVISKKAA